jgi:ATP-dependent helicase HrpB
MQSLPIDSLLPRIVEALAGAQRLVLQAPPGTGKSTRVPPALLNSLEAGHVILVAEPRRIAARLLANRVASEHGQAVGERVGYRVRFEDVCGPTTRLVYVTSGVLLRLLLGDPRLAGVGAVIIDEFHERHLDADLSLALALRAQRSWRPDLLIVVMSATIQGERVQEMMGGCPFIRSEESTYPVTIEYEPRTDERPLAQRVLSAVKGHLRNGPRGNILVFLPGASDIRQACKALTPVTSEFDVDILPLHGDMPLGVQAKVLGPSNRNKVVISTNVAESSITVPGIVGVVDSGLSRTTSCSPWSGLPSLDIHKISRSSAAQRAGRAGRLIPGRVSRLFTRADFDLRLEFEVPEILRLDLCEAVLLTRGAGILDLRELSLVDSPPASLLQAAEHLLSELAAISGDGEITPLGRQMLRFPVHPRLARLIIEASQRGEAGAGCLAAALLSERDLRIDSRVSVTGAYAAADLHSGDSDVVELQEAFEFAESNKFDSQACYRERIDAGAARAVSTTRNQLMRCVRGIQRSGDPQVAGEPGLAQALLLAFPDRVAWRREPSRHELVMTNGNTAQLSERSVVRDARYLVALVAEERRTGGKKGATMIRLACRIDPNWLLELLPKRTAADERLLWLDPPGRVESLATIRYGAVVLDESRFAAKPGPTVAKLLATVAEGKGILNDDALSSLRERTNILIQYGLLPEETRLTESAIRLELEEECLNRIDLVGLDGAALANQVKATMPVSAAKALREWAPESYQLKGGRTVAIHYESGREPWMASRLQDFFGMTETPRICRGRQVVTLQLLAPNQRAVQITQDLNGFWDRHYPSIRRELMRRYPKHFWPEDGRTAQAPRGTRR